MIVGIGIIVGSKIAGEVAALSTGADGAMNYRKLFETPMWAAVFTLVMLMMFYLPGKSKRGAAT